MSSFNSVFDDAKAEAEIQAGQNEDSAAAIKRAADLNAAQLFIGTDLVGLLAQASSDLEESGADVGYSVATADDRQGDWCFPQAIFRASSLDRQHSSSAYLIQILEDGSVKAYKEGQNLLRLGQVGAAALEKASDVINIAIEELRNKLAAG